MVKWDAGSAVCCSRAPGNCGPTRPRRPDEGGAAAAVVFLEEKGRICLVLFGVWSRPYRFVFVSFGLDLLVSGFGV